MPRRKAVNQSGKPALPDLNARQREKQVVQMRMAGHDFDTIAAVCGYASRSGAHHAWKRAIRAIPAEDAAEARQLECQRLDQLLNVYWPKALSGDGWSMDRCLRIGERRASLLGLDMQPDVSQAQQMIVIGIPQAVLEAV